MPRNRDMQLYHQIQAKLTQQEVDYQNMHTHSTIVRGDHGKVTKIDGDQYHPDMQLKQFEPNGAQLAHYASGDFKPQGSEQHSSAATPAAFVAQGTISTGQRPSRDVVMADGRSLMTLPALPEANQDEQVWFSEEREGTRSNLRRQAPNQNPSVDLIDMEVDFGDEEQKEEHSERSRGARYVSNIAERVKKRHAEQRRSGARVGQTRREDIAEKRREKSAKEKQSDRQAKFERRRNTKNPRKRKDNPMHKRRSTMEY